MLIVGAAIVWGAAGCAQHRPFADLWVTPRPLHQEVVPARPSPDALSYNRLGEAERATPDLENPAGAITMHDAVALALRHNPALAADSWATLAAEADARQAGRPPNPRVTFATENFGGPEGGPTLERHTLRLSQTIELAGKRGRREALGTTTQRLRAWDYEARRIETAAQAATRYIAVVIAQERAALAQRQLDLAESAYGIAEQRVAAGTAPGLERDQAAVRRSLRRIAVDKAGQALDAARADLAASWGAPAAAFTEAAGELDARHELPALDALRDRLAQSPAVARWDDELAQRQAALELARANAVTDPTVGVGLRYFPEADTAAGVAEVSWPLAVLDDRRDAVLAARLRVTQADHLRRAARAEADRALANTYARCRAAETELRALADDTLPAATRAYDAAVSAYEAGQTDYLAALEAERTLLEVQTHRLDALAAYHTATVELERLTASPLNMP